MRHAADVDTTAALLGPIADRARSWLLDTAFPVWFERGIDRARGGFHERLTLDGEPTDDPRRAFVQGRQAYCFCEAGRLGWHGAWEEAARHAADYLIDRFLRPEGAIIHAVDPDGHPVDGSVDLYDVAFALFGLAHVYETCGRVPRDRAAARAILAYLRRDRSHPRIGFVEADGVALRQNPHMHLLEAALAWIRADGEACWWTLAEDLVALAERHLIDTSTGAVFEHYATDWTPLGGREAAVVEPGHQYEWAYLLTEWDRLRQVDRRPDCEHLFLLAEEHGRDPRRGVAVSDLDVRGRKTNRTARIWAQTERLRTAVTLLPVMPACHRATPLGAAIEAATALEQFLDVPLAGLWRDKWLADGRFVEETVPASSLYHIVTGYTALLKPFGPHDR